VARGSQPQPRARRAREGRQEVAYPAGEHVWRGALELETMPAWHTADGHAPTPRPLNGQKLTWPCAASQPAPRRCAQHLQGSSSIELAGLNSQDERIPLGLRKDQRPSPIFCVSNGHHASFDGDFNATARGIRAPRGFDEIAVGKLRKDFLTHDPICRPTFRLCQHRGLCTG